MKKGRSVMKKILALLLALSLLLCGCAGDSGETAANTQPTGESSEPTETTVTDPLSTEATQTTEVTEPETQPTEPELPYADPLTGEKLAEPCLNRPYALAIDNDNKSAMPHWGVSQADMLWELPHEGGSTRMVGLFCDVSDVDRLGPTRSVRPYILSVAQSFNAILVHAGGSPQGYDLLESTGWPHLDGVQGVGADSYYHRDKDRLNAGIDSWHTMYTTGQEVLKYTKKLGYSNTLSQTADYGLTFAEDGTPDGDSAETVTIRFRKSGKKTTLYYHQDTGKYTMEQFGMTYTDGNNGNAVTFENVLVLKTSVSTIDDYGRLSVTLEGSGEGYFACGGKIVPILWSRAGSNQPFVYTLKDGTPLELGIGTTYVAVTYKNGTVSY